MNLRVLLVCVFTFVFCQSLRAENGNEIIGHVDFFRGDSLIETRIRTSSDVGLAFFPGGKNIGISYDFLYRHPNFPTLRPFTNDHNDKMHSLGILIRFPDEGRFQPMLGGGVMRYISHITVWRGKERLVDGNNGETIPVVRFWLGIKLYKGLMFIPKAEASGLARIQGNIGAGLGYDFNFGKRGH